MSAGTGLDLINSRRGANDKESVIVDIHTEGEYYTEVFSWGSDTEGQLGLGIQQISGASAEQNYPVPRFCSYNITIR